MTSPIRDHKVSERMIAALQDILEELVGSGHDAADMIRLNGGLPRFSHRILFYTLGFVAKGDGRVTERDVAYTEELIQALKLSQSQRAKAISQFNSGKQLENLSPLRGMRVRLATAIRPDITLMVATCLVHATQLSGQPTRQRRIRCEDACELMGLPTHIMNKLLDSYSRRNWNKGKASSVPMERPDSYVSACRILGVAASEPLSEIKRAYRRKMGSCHPDKLPPNLSTEERERARDQLLQYQQAWELVRRRHRL